MTDEFQLDNEARVEAAYERLGTRDPICSIPGCTENDWRALTGTYPGIKCYEHLCMEQRRSPVERHHLKGVKNNKHLEVSMTANDHRILESYKNNWPKETRENPDGSPALYAAGHVRRTYDWLVMIAKRYLEPVFLWFEALEKSMCEQHGRRWWVTLDLPDVLGSRGVQS